MVQKGKPGPLKQHAYVELTDGGHGRGWLRLLSRPDYARRIQSSPGGYSTYGVLYYVAGAAQAKGPRPEVGFHLVAEQDGTVTARRASWRDPGVTFDSEQAANDAVDRWLAAGAVGVTLEDVRVTRKRRKDEKEAARVLRSKAAADKIVGRFKGLTDADLLRIAQEAEAVVAGRQQKAG